MLITAATTFAQTAASDGSAAAPVPTPDAAVTVAYDDATEPLPPAVPTGPVSFPYNSNVAQRLQDLEAKLQQQQALTVSLQQQLQSQQAQQTLASAAPPAPKRYIVGSDTTMIAKWLPDGLTFISKNGDFKTHLGGSVNLDYVAIRNNNPGITSSPAEGTNDAVEFRRLRVRAEGTMYENVDWVSEFDFAQQLVNPTPFASQPANGLRNAGTSTIAGGAQQSGNTFNGIAPTTVFMTFKEIRLLGNVRVGNQQDWIGFEHIESARFTDFMERATIMDAYYGPNNNGYTPGISFFNSIAGGNLNYYGGFYHNNAYDGPWTFDYGDHNWTYNLRTTWTPFYDEPTNGRYLMHVGLGSEYRTFNTNLTSATGFDNIRIRSRGVLRTSASTLDPNFADTGNFYTQNQTLVDPEFAFQWGSLLIQSEWTNSWFGGAATSQPGNPGGGGFGTITSARLAHNAYTQGGYVSAMYFLTGESRVYLRQAGVFGRTIPLQNAFSTRGGWGIGAWQVGIRYDWLDLNTQGGAAQLNGGNEQDLTLGLNWFLNPNARFMVNGVGSWVNNAAAVNANNAGALNGSRFTGDGTILSFGTRMDFTF